MNSQILKILSTKLKSRKIKFDIITGFFFLFLLSNSISFTYNIFQNRNLALEFGNQLIKTSSDVINLKTKKYLEDVKNISLLSKSDIDTNNPYQQDFKKLKLNMIDVLSLYPSQDVIQYAFPNGDYISAEQVKPYTKYITDPKRNLSENIKFLTQVQIRSDSTSKPHEIWTYYDANKKIISQETSYDLTYDARTRPWYSATLQKRDFNWSPVYVFSFLNVPGITGAVPITSEKNGESDVVAILGIDLSLAEISSFLKKNQPSATAKIVLISQDEKIVASTLENIDIDNDNKAELINVNTIKDEVFKKAYDIYKRDRTATFHFNFNNNDYLASFNQIDDFSKSNWVSGIVVPSSDFLDQIHHIYYNVILINLLILIFSLYLIVKFSQKISEPIIEISKETERIQNLDLSHPATIVSNISEIQIMVSAIKSLRQSLITFSKFVPKALVKKLLLSGQEIKLGGKKKDVVIFFSDIANFTNISEKIPPEKLIVQLSDYLNDLSKIITTTNGTIDKYIGDAIMAFWGAPISDKNYILNACHAAISCQKRIDELNRQWDFEGKPIFSTRMGIHKSEVIVGTIGSEEKMNYTVIGDGVNLASRLEGANKYYQTRIIASETVEEIARNHFLFRPLDIIVVKGKQQGVKIYELVAQLKGDSIFLPSEQQIDLCSRFSKAFKYYLNQRWDDALEILIELHKDFPTDYITKMYIDRCQAFKESPPPENWNSSTTMTEK